MLAYPLQDVKKNQIKTRVSSNKISASSVELHVTGWLTIVEDSTCVSCTAEVGATHMKPIMPEVGLRRVPFQLVGREQEIVGADKFIALVRGAVHVESIGGDNFVLHAAAADEGDGVALGIAYPIHHISMAELVEVEQHQRIFSL